MHIANPAGGGFSRNPPDRDQVRDDVFEKPKAFSEVWEIARASAQSKADTDFVIRSSVVEGRPDFTWKGCQPVWVRPTYDAKTADPVLSAVYAPGYVSDGKELDFSKHQVEGNGVILKQMVVLQPPLISGVGCRRWLEK